MKWPASLTVMRHAESVYNILKAKKAEDPQYQEFKREFEKHPYSDKTRALAVLVGEKYALKMSDYDTPLSVIGRTQAETTGYKMRRGTEHSFVKPDVVLVSPYVRTRETLDLVQSGGFNLGDTPVVHEDRIREQEHGLSLLHSDWRVFHALNPDQKRLRDTMGPYWYQYPQGESVSMVRDRIRDVLSMIIREYAGQHVLMVTHHLTILSLRANLERLSPEEFIRLDNHEKPVNCGITIYRGEPKLGKNGKLVLESYNTCLWDQPKAA